MQDLHEKWSIDMSGERENGHFGSVTAQGLLKLTQLADMVYVLRAYSLQASSKSGKTSLSLLKSKVCAKSGQVAPLAVLH